MSRVSSISLVERAHQVNIGQILIGQADWTDGAAAANVNNYSASVVVAGSGVVMTWFGVSG
jgi:hypothetical protein